MEHLGWKKQKDLRQLRYKCSKTGYEVNKEKGLHKLRIEQPSARKDKHFDVFIN